MATRLTKLSIGKVALVPKGANQEAYVLLYKMDKAEWTTATVNNFPDSSFAYVEPGDKDPDGKTTPRSKRHLPYKDAAGKPDAAHTRNALSRLPQTNISASAKASAKRKLLAAARSLGINATTNTQKDLGMDDTAMAMDEERESPPMTLEERQQARQLYAQWGPLWRDFCATVNEIMDWDDDDAQYADILMQSIEQFSTQATAILSDLGLLTKAAPLFAVLNEVTKAGAVMSGARRARLQAAIGALQAILDEANPQTGGETTTPATKGVRMTVTVDEITKRAETAEARVHVLEAELLQAKMSPEEQEAEYLKNLPDAVRKQYTADKVEKAALREELRIEKEARQRQEYIEKTVTYRLVGMTPDHWNVLKAIDGLPQQERDELLRMLASAHEVIKTSGLLKVHGKDGVAPVMGSALERIEKMARERAAASEGKLTYEQAYDRISSEQPTLFAEARSEQRRVA